MFDVLPIETQLLKVRTFSDLHLEPQRLSHRRYACALARIAVTVLTLRLDGLQVPFESLKRTARDRKNIVEEVNSISQAIAKLAARKDISRVQACADLTVLTQRLEQLQQEVRFYM
jgi:hypothetical protein